MKTKDLANSKLPLGIVVAIVLQTAALVYYVGKQANQFETMKDTVAQQDKQLEKVFNKVQQHDIELERTMKKLNEDRVRVMEKAFVVAPPPVDATPPPVDAAKNTDKGDKSDTLDVKSSKDPKKDH